MGTWTPLRPLTSRPPKNRLLVSSVLSICDDQVWPAQSARKV
ncbi:hypothetical protein MGSAQ_001943 [marine sediment metagenome]|uniref:Uncharacterized protein n=1 Tax=marine sediment metagenome TaxID=412755 RepID=A0A1B6NTD2_9ZZZZ